MDRLCPECGEPPHYHSFCTRCCKLFMRGTRHKTQLMPAWAARRAACAARRAEMRSKIEALKAEGLDLATAAERLAVTPLSLRVTTFRMGIAPFVTSPTHLRRKGHPHALDAR